MKKIGDATFGSVDEATWQYLRDWLGNSCLYFWISPEARVYLYLIQTLAYLVSVKTRVVVPVDHDHDWCGGIQGRVEHMILSGLSLSRMVVGDDSMQGHLLGHWALVLLFWFVMLDWEAVLKWRTVTWSKIDYKRYYRNSPLSILVFNASVRVRT